MSNDALLIDPLGFAVRAQGGVARVWAALLPRLVALGVPIRFTSGEEGREAMAHGLSNALLSFASAHRIPAKIRRFVPYRGGVPFFPTYYRPCRTGHPNIQLVHDCVKELYYSPPKLELVRYRRKRIYDNATRLISISDTTRLELARLFGDAIYEKTKVIHNPVDFDRIRSLADSKAELPGLLEAYARISGRPYAAYIGHRGGYKNFLEVRTLLRALPEHLVVTVGGPPPTPAERQLSSEHGERIVYLGPASDEVMFRLLKQSDFLFWPTRIEGFGLPLIESLAVGTPVIALNTPINVEVSLGRLSMFESGSTASIEEAARSARRIPSDDPVVAQLCDRYRPDHVAAAYADCIRNFLADARHR